MPHRQVMGSGNPKPIPSRFHGHREREREKTIAKFTSSSFLYEGNVCVHCVSLEEWEWTLCSHFTIIISCLFFFSSYYSIWEDDESAHTLLTSQGLGWLGQMKFFSLFHRNKREVFILSLLFKNLCITLHHKRCSSTLSLVLVRERERERGWWNVPWMWETKKRAKGEEEGTSRLVLLWEIIRQKKRERNPKFFFFFTWNDYDDDDGKSWKLSETTELVIVSHSPIQSQRDGSRPSSWENEWMNEKERDTDTYLPYYVLLHLLLLY